MVIDIIVATGVMFVVMAVGYGVIQLAEGVNAARRIAEVLEASHSAETVGLSEYLSRHPDERELLRAKWRG